MTSSIPEPHQIQQAEHPGPALKRTPQAKGTAAINEHLDFVGTQVHNIRQWIRQDVKELKNVPVNKMLKEILVDCSKPGESFNEDAKTSLFEECLEAVLPICNGEAQAKKVQAKNKNKKEKVTSGEIKENLKKYSELYDAHENELYTPFVKAANTAVLFLQEVEVKHLREANNFKIRFHVLDPSKLKQEHGKTSTLERKPDVIVVSETDLRIPEGGFLLKVTAKRPETAFEWRNVRTFVEFKQTSTKAKMDPPPKSYGPYAAPEGHESDQVSALPAAPAMSSANPQLALKPGPARHSAHQQEKAKATDSPKTASKWRKIRSVLPFKQTSTKDEKESPPPKSYKPYTAPTPEYLRLEGHESDQVSALPAAPTTSSANPQLALKPGTRSARQLGKAMATDSRDRKRTSKSAELTPSEYQRKRFKYSQEKTDKDAIVQAGDYAAELFSTHAGRLHVFGLIIVGDILYLWRYDREGAIQCSGFNFIQDLPRFLVLLLAMQRFENRDWGLNPDIDPDFGERRPHETTLTGAKDVQITLTLELSDEHRVTHFGLNGRATNVFPAKISAQSRNLSGREDIVVKVFWPQAERTSEPTILEKVDDIAKHNDDVNGHVPQMLWYQKFEETSTANIRNRLGLNVAPQSSRVLYMVIFRRLSTIRELVGNDFLQAWWATVKCHRALWKKGVYHRDISDSNLMYYRDNEGAIVGVLNDFDLATIKETPTGTQRTGTLPFMALALLEDAEGRTKHLYEHDAESFIWILIWISLQYSDGKPRKNRRPLDEWLGKDATQCREKKAGLLYSEKLWALQAGEGHARNWKLAKDCIYALQNPLNRAKGPRQPLDVDTAFETLLGDPYSNLSNVYSTH